jgi:hypothetical protein
MTSSRLPMSRSRKGNLTATAMRRIMKGESKNVETQKKKKTKIPKQ